MEKKVTDKKLDTLLETLAANKFPYIIASPEVLQIMYPETEWTSGLIIDKDNNLKIFCSDSCEGKFYTNLNIDWEDIWNTEEKKSDNKQA